MDFLFTPWTISAMIFMVGIILIFGLILIIDEYQMGAARAAHQQRKHDYQKAEMLKAEAKTISQPEEMA